MSGSNKDQSKENGVPKTDNDIPNAEPKPTKSKCGFCVYIGPSIRAGIQHGAIIAMTREKALKEHESVIEQYPLVSSLIVSGDDLPVSNSKVKQPGNALYENYKRLATTLQN